MLKPGVVKKYLPESRLCEVEIPGVTDGADTYPLAEIVQNIGDKSEHTEIRILEGDRVWLMFNDDDPGKPVIVGFRAKERGNVTEWRRWHHDNIQMDADGKEGTILMNAEQSINGNAGKTIVWDAGESISENAGKTITLKAGERITLEANGSTIVMDGSGIKINGKRIDLN